MSPSKPGKSHPDTQRLRTLRSACKGDCATGNEKGHHHHHHHHGNQFEQQQQYSTNASESVTNKRPQNSLGSPSPQKSKHLSSKKPSSTSHQNRSITKTISHTEKATLASSPIKSPTIALNKNWVDLNNLKKIISLSETTGARFSQNYSSVKTITTNTSQNAYHSTLMPRNSLDALDGKAASLSLESLASTIAVSPADWIGTNSEKSSPSDSFKRTKNHYSDYSSGEDLDFDDYKTDYTYARSASYVIEKDSPFSVPSPNMSRPRLRDGSLNRSPNSLNRSEEHQSSEYYILGNRVRIE